MRLLDGLAELIAPTRCAGCDRPGSVLCRECLRRLEAFDAYAACPRCGAPFGRLVCTECWESEFAFEATVSLGVLEAPLSRAVVLHKDAGERRLGPELGRLLAEAVARRWGQWATAITWIPPTKAALSRRGFDHGRSIATKVADMHGLPAVSPLVRDTARDQRSLSRAQRAANTSFSAVAATCGNVLIVDDVLTTGATLDAAARALVEAGADAVRVAVVARAW